MSGVIHAVPSQEELHSQILQRYRTVAQVVRQRRHHEEQVRPVQPRMVRRHPRRDESHPHPPVNDARRSDSIYLPKVPHGEPQVHGGQRGRDVRECVREQGRDVLAERLVEGTAQPVGAPARGPRVPHLPLPLVLVVPGQRLDAPERSDAARRVRQRHQEGRPPPPGRRVREQLRSVPVEGHHVHEEVRRLGVVEDGEEHGAEGPALDAVRPAEAEPGAEVVAVGVDEDVREDQEVQGGPGAFAAEAATHGAACVLRSRAALPERGGGRRRQEKNVELKILGRGMM